MMKQKIKDKYKNSRIFRKLGKINNIKRYFNSKSEFDVKMLQIEDSLGFISKQ